MWSCVEDRIEEGELFGRIIRKLIFDDLYADRSAVIRQNPISRKILPDMKVSLYGKYTSLSATNVFYGKY